MFVAVVPAYNEEKTIGSVVQSLFAHVDKVIVVDDCSCDNTYKQALTSGAIVLQHKINRGQGAALQTGHDYALQIGADYVLHFDGDNQFCVEDIKPALKKLKDSGVDILFGSRFLDNRTQLPWFKKYILFPVAKIFNKICGVDLEDTHNGFRILNKKALEQITIEQDRMAHATEIPAKAKKLGLQYVEFPVKVVYHKFGQGLGGGFKVARDLVFGKFVK
ncbi:MAG TPA: glycosyl transferase [Candidatus Magasanikbacteria bacterium]|nr:glycosyl transferase [Candidatus Magasanikbacteria bacterium]